MAGSLYSSRRRNPTVDLAAWLAALAEAKLRGAATAMGVLVITHLDASIETKTTRKKLAAAMGVAERTLARHLRQLMAAGLVRIVQHHDPQTGWHTDSTYRLTLPVAAAATEAALPAQPIATCMHQGAESGTEAKVPKMAEHLAVHWGVPIDGTPKADEATATNISGASRPPDTGGTGATVIQPENWGRALLAAKAGLVRLADPDRDQDRGGPIASLHLGKQPSLRHAGGAA
jgi:DNA-binding transcriptional ArsR family regulator